MNASGCLRKMVEHSGSPLEWGSVKLILLLCVRGVGVVGGEGWGVVCEGIMENIAAVLGFHCRRLDEG